MVFLLEKLDLINKLKILFTFQNNWKKLKKKCEKAGIFTHYATSIIFIFSCNSKMINRRDWNYFS